MYKFMIALLGSALMAASAAQAADVQAGKAAFDKHNCASCHGADAKSPIQEDYPILAGQHRDYLAHALRAYQRGQAGAPASANVRKNPVMGAMATQLSSTEVEDVAAWLASLETPLSVTVNDFGRDL